MPFVLRLTRAGMRAAGPAERFVYATSTMRGHQLVGEERFSVEWHQKDNSVWYAYLVCANPCCVALEQKDGLG